MEGGLLLPSHQSQQNEDENLLQMLFTQEFIDNNQQTLKEFTQKTKQYHSEPAAVERQWSAIFNHDTCNHLQNITAPTLVLTGDQDRAIPSENSNFLAKNIPGAKLEEIKDAAHAFCYSHPDETAKFAIDFLQ